MANEDQIELKAYRATNHVCRRSEVERMIKNVESMGRIHWGMRRRSWTLPANDVHGRSLGFAVPRIQEMMITSDPNGSLCRVGLCVKHRRTELVYDIAQARPV